MQSAHTPQLPYGRDVFDSLPPTNVLLTTELEFQREQRWKLQHSHDDRLREITRLHKTLGVKDKLIGKLNKNNAALTTQQKELVATKKDLTDALEANAQKIASQEEEILALTAQVTTLKEQLDSARQFEPLEFSQNSRNSLSINDLLE